VSTLVDANDLSLAPTLKVDANNLSSASTSVHFMPTLLIFWLFFFYIFLFNFFYYSVRTLASTKVDTNNPSIASTLKVNANNHSSVSILCRRC
jgi:hypothetical protein